MRPRQPETEVQFSDVPKKFQSAVILRVELLGIEPLVWRRVRVPAAMTLRELHSVLQVVMGWQDCHLH
jgi:hypothetical protein